MGKILFANDMQRSAYESPVMTLEQGSDPKYYENIMGGKSFNVNACVTIMRDIDAMQGRPTWVASLAIKVPDGALVPISSWQKQTIKAAVSQFTRYILKGVGNDGLQRLFAMDKIICFQRALTNEEIEGLPDWFLSYKPTDAFGGPRRNFFFTGIPEDSPTTQPCIKPAKIYHDLQGNYSLEDCDNCRPCRARLAISQFVEGLEWPLPEKELYRKVEGHIRRLSKVQDILVVGG